MDKNIDVANNIKIFAIKRKKDESMRIVKATLELMRKAAGENDGTNN